MKKIDNETVSRILEAAEIVDVVSDFVKLKRSGANYKGLCPFHNERTPSFSVSPSRNLCKCFSCGKGGSPVGFIMELEQCSYNEALRYLAKKYNIEIKEHAMSEAEQREDTDRQSMYALNEFAMGHFEHTLTETDEGRNVGLAYYRQRGINDAMIKRFHLGYSPERGNDLCHTALEKGFNEKYLIDTGLGVKTERGTLYDRFRGRVIYPWHTISGRIAGFSGRILRNDKPNTGKYVNSPESLIYSKFNEVYGLYQAKQAISRADKCILVEGQMDVISMHQAGVENVVASSGTSLTQGQIKKIQRFTHNVTVIYDSDKAGIKASMRGIDMLLSADLDIKVVLLPDGDDPDSFAQSHSSSEVEEYIRQHEEDFIRFKARILLDDSGNDPLKRAEVINSVMQSIAVMPQEVKRVVYTAECARMFGVPEDVLTRQLGALLGKKAVEDEKNRRRSQAAATLGDINDKPSPEQPVQPETQQSEPKVEVKSQDAIEPYEREVVRYLLKYAFYDFCLTTDQEGNPRPMNVFQYVTSEFMADRITFECKDYAHIFKELGRLHSDEWSEDYLKYKAKCEATRQAAIAAGMDKIRLEGKNVADIQARENALMAETETAYNEAIVEYACDYAQRVFLSADDEVLRRITNNLAIERHQLSKVHTKYARIETERERLPELVKRSVYELKDAIIAKEMSVLRRELNDPAITNERMIEIMESLNELQAVRNKFANYLGERIITPVIFK